jgi:hypothetical protein
MRTKNQMGAIRPQSRVRFVAAALVLVAAATSGCRAKQELIIQDKQVPALQLVTDSSAVSRLISNEETTEEKVLDSWQKNNRPENAVQRLKDVAEHPELYTPGRDDFLMAMHQQPAVIVHGPAHVEIVKTSLAACTLIPFATTNFVMVRVVEGPERGEEGWLCSEKIGVNEANSNVSDQVNVEPPLKTTLCELMAHPETYTGRIVEIRAAVELGFEVSLLVDKTCSASIWFDRTTTKFDEDQYRRMEEYLRNNNDVATVAGRFDHVGWFTRRKGNGFGHLGQWQSQLVLQSFKGADSER